MTETAAVVKKKTRRSPSEVKADLQARIKAIEQEEQVRLKTVMERYSRELRELATSAGGHSPTLVSCADSLAKAASTIKVPQ